MRYELGIRRDTSAQPLRMGKAFQLGLEARDNGAALADAIAVACRDYETLPAWCNTDEGVHAWMVERETVAAMLDGYYWRWSEVDAPGSTDPFGVAEVLAAELAFEVPIVNPDTGKATPSFKLAGKIDAIVKLCDGRIAVKENKTCSDDLGAESDYWKRLRIDQQISTYYIAARAMGYDIQTVIYDASRKPDISPRQVPLIDAEGFKIVLDREGNRVMTKDGKKPRESGDSAAGYTLQARLETPQEFGERFRADIRERPHHYFARQEIPRLESDLTEFGHELWQQQQQLRDAQRSGRWFRNTSACIGFGKCPYFDICTNGTDLTAGIPAGFVRVPHMHPELAITGD